MPQGKDYTQKFWIYFNCIYGPIQAEELNLMIRVDPFQLNLFCDSEIIVNYVTLNNVNN